MKNLLSGTFELLKSQQHPQKQVGQQDLVLAGRRCKTCEGRAPVGVQVSIYQPAV